MKRTLFNCFCVTALLGLFTLFNSCVITPDINSSETPDEVVTEKETVTESEPVPEKPVVSLYVPEKIERVFFSFNDESLMHDLEIGSPNALNSAALKLKKSASNYTEPEAVALSVASSIMSMVWPYQKNTIEVPDYPINANPYTASI